MASQGDRSALAFVKELDNAITNNNIVQLGVIENNLLGKAHKEFEFLSKHEYSDLVRLKEDRNYCAHPAFVDLENLFQPTAEIVRAHIVHAIFHLLRHQPIQGRSALTRILDDIKRPSFPSDRKSVSEFLGDKYLNHAKDSLIENLITVLVKLLLKNNEQEFRGKEELITNSLLTIADTHSALYEQTMARKLSSIVESVDVQLINIFRLLVADPKCWGFLTQNVFLK